MLSWTERVREIFIEQTKNYDEDGELLSVDSLNNVRSFSSIGKRGFFQGYNDPLNEDAFYLSGIYFNNGLPILNNSKKNNFVPIDSLKHVTYDLSI